MGINNNVPLILMEINGDMDLDLSKQAKRVYFLFFMDD